MPHFWHHCNLVTYVKMQCCWEVLVPWDHSSRGTGSGTQRWQLEFPCVPCSSNTDKCGTAHVGLASPIPVLRLPVVRIGKKVPFRACALGSSRTELSPSTLWEHPGRKKHGAAHSILDTLLVTIWVPACLREGTWWTLAWRDQTILGVFWSFQPHYLNIS